MQVWQMDTWELLRSGGPLMIPLLLCSIFALAIIIEKLIYFSTIRDNPHAIRTTVFQYLNDNKIKEAITFCEKNQSPVSRVIGSGLLRFGSSKEEIRDTLNDSIQSEIPKLEKRLPVLNTIAQIAPLIGLLGTVIGLASCFYTIQVRATSMTPISPGDLAGGVWEALVTTITGLLIAIPVYIIYNYLVSRVDQFILEMEQGATELINHLTQI